MVLQLLLVSMLPLLGKGRGPLAGQLLRGRGGAASPASSTLSKDPGWGGAKHPDTWLGARALGQVGRAKGSRREHHDLTEGRKDGPAGLRWASKAEASWNGEVG